MAIEALLLHLEREAEREVARVRGEAAEAAGAIVARADADAARRRSLHGAEVERQALAAADRDVAAARAHARHDLLRLREAVLARILARAGEMLAGTSAVESRGTLAALARDTARYLEGTSARLECTPEAKAIVATAVKDLPGLTVRPVASAAGVVGRTDDGRVLVDNSLPAVLARRADEFSIALARRIEEG